MSQIEISISTSGTSMDTGDEQMAQQSSESIVQSLPARLSTKRRMVDSNGQEIQDPKRARAEPDDDLKLNARDSFSIGMNTF